MRTQFRTGMSALRQVIIVGKYKLYNASGPYGVLHPDGSMTEDHACFPGEIYPMALRLRVVKEHRRKAETATEPTSGTYHRASRAMVSANRNRLARTAPASTISLRT